MWQEEFMSAYGEQLRVIRRQAEIQKELEGSNEDMDRCITAAPCAKLLCNGHGHPTSAWEAT